MKQVIVIRKDLKMRRGKEIAQCCHASMAFITKQIKNNEYDSNCDKHKTICLDLHNDHLYWINNDFRKIVVQVNSEQELLDIYNKAKDAKLTCHLILDKGLTEFKEPTHTCCAIGPDQDDLVDCITGHLKLY